MVFLVYHDVARVGDESHRLPEYKYGVESEYAVTYYYEAPYKTDNPKPDRQDGLVAAIGIVPLVDEPYGEDDLPCRTIDE